MDRLLDIKSLVQKSEYQEKGCVRGKEKTTNLLKSRNCTFWLIQELQCVAQLRQSSRWGCNHTRLIQSQRQGRIMIVSKFRWWELTGTVYKNFGKGFASGQFSRTSLSEEALIPSASVSIAIQKAVKKRGPEEMNSLILRIISPRSSSSNGSTPLYTIYLFQKMLLSQSLIQKFAITKKGGEDSRVNRRFN